VADVADRADDLDPVAGVDVAVHLAGDHRGGVVVSSRGCHVPGLTGGTVTDVSDVADRPDDLAAVAVLDVAVDGPEDHRRVAGRLA
jgi:hypothetical protein